MLFSVNEKALCFHVGLLYEAKVSPEEARKGGNVLPQGMMVERHTSMLMPRRDAD